MGWVTWTGVFAIVDHFSLTLSCRARGNWPLTQDTDWQLMNHNARLDANANTLPSSHAYGTALDRSSNGQGSRVQLHARWIRLRPSTVAPYR